MENTRPVRKTSIGGQALIEGVMMRGPETSAMAIRQPDGEIHIETWKTKGLSAWYRKVPFLRGSFNFVDSLMSGYKCLMRSAEVAGFEEEPSDFEKRMMEKFGDKFYTMLSGVVMVLALVLSVGLFIVLPTFLVSLIGRFVTNGALLTTIEGLTKILIFLLYIILVSRTPDIRRVFEYHGAEHKSIACYEAGEELTVENVAKFTRFHPRCGTSFILIVLVVSILVFSLVTWDSLLTRVILKIVMLPVTVGIAYEIIRLAGRYDNWLTRIISAPGLWLQRFTTNEPDATQIEVAIASLVPCIPGREGADKW